MWLHENDSMKYFTIRIIQLPLLSQNSFNFFCFRRKLSNIELCLKADENRAILSLAWHLSLSRFRVLKQSKTKNWLSISGDVKKAVKSKLLKSSSNLLVWKILSWKYLQNWARIWTCWMREKWNDQRNSVCNTWSGCKQKETSLLSRDNSAFLLSQFLSLPGKT